MFNYVKVYCPARSISLKVVTIVRVLATPPNLHSKALCHLVATVAKFIVSEWGDKVNSGIGFSYWGQILNP